ncbi:MAG: hypothetical protein A3H50_03580 [Candidatus Levybacteria bacterium RIFCSPLOWO2_02_FULL_37_10]|nr:MAG: hypothetical protein A2860_02345 [Candidatus Levybacteria bacterium RIFCSPHIGHO2_01_FULL_37_33]OGH15796.1 MAG: hypothetical protein A3C97_00950 [Candidatus Levybacteria bacterium RIFCSPHIGHO2_02_FULL_37_11]OGH30019.1 MAG: hypothetical protein A3F30_02355 [Candidatus Levybacteria bacterium RIFCSPHIGHO2_12_FULL_37_12]OGH43139.1 MAG: hypothetical protein A3H50_03580 [Candidatus Levybacteria bacterium RIFCSPLOWO2_02_FULL_37_10]
MKIVNLSKLLKKYKSGWVALNKEDKIVAHGKTFALTCQKIKDMKDVLLVPVSQNYFGFVTLCNG